MTPSKQLAYEFSADSILSTRQKLGMSQAQLAQLVGVPPITISRWETGGTTPNATNLAAIYSIAVERGTTPGFFRKRKLIEKAERDYDKKKQGKHKVIAQKQVEKCLLVMWDFQNMPESPKNVEAIDAWLRTDLSSQFKNIQLRRFKVFVPSYQTEVTNEFQRLGWRVVPVRQNADEIIKTQSRSDCGQNPRSTVVVFVTNDNGFTELVEDLRSKGVTVYVMGHTNINSRLRGIVGETFWIEWNPQTSYDYEDDDDD